MPLRMPAPCNGIAQDYNRPAALADLLSQLGVDPRVGLSRDDAMARRSLYGANRVTPPINCPSWVCCLLPCLLRTASMQAFHAALPREAVVRRQATSALGGPAAASPPSSQATGTAAAASKKQQQQPRKSHSLRMDASSLVYGDIVELSAGDLVSADMRVVECSDDCVVDQSTLAADDGDVESERSLIRKLVAVQLDGRERSDDPLRARNVLLMASRVVRGHAVGVVIATGDRTLWGQLLAKHQWPVPSTSKRAGRVDKYIATDRSSANPEEHRLMGGDNDDTPSNKKAVAKKKTKQSKSGELIV